MPAFLRLSYSAKSTTLPSTILRDSLPLPRDRMRTITAMLLLSLHTSLAATPIYTWQDAQGQTHFSDMPHQGAETVTLAPPATATLDQPATPALRDAQPASPPLRLTLASPADQQTLRENNGDITLVLTTNRPLAAHEQIQVLLDGAPFGPPQARLHWQLHNIDRGSHRLQAQIIKDGKVIASSQDITVFLHRASVLSRPSPAPKPK